MMIREIVLCCTLAIPLPAASLTLCEILDDVDVGELQLAQGLAQCRASLALGGARSVHCVLEYEYRSDSATQVFSELTDALVACSDPAVTMIEDQSVNHPDAFVLRTFENALNTYAVSIKDKGALQQTLVFVRVTRP